MSVMDNNSSNCLTRSRLFTQLFASFKLGLLQMLKTPVLLEGELLVGNAYSSFIFFLSIRPVQLMNGERLLNTLWHGRKACKGNWVYFYGYGVSSIQNSPLQIGGSYLQTLRLLKWVSGFAQKE
jgi:hypothetical protein